jgi:hypothetical protein
MPRSFNAPVIASSEITPLALIALDNRHQACDEFINCGWFERPDSQHRLAQCYEEYWHRAGSLRGQS